MKVLSDDLDIIYKAQLVQNEDGSCAVICARHRDASDEKLQHFAKIQSAMISLNNLQAKASPLSIHQLQPSQSDSAETQTTTETRDAEV